MTRLSRSPIFFSPFLGSKYFFAHFELVPLVILVSGSIESLEVSSFMRLCAMVTPSIEGSIDMAPENPLSTTWRGAWGTSVIQITERIQNMYCKLTLALRIGRDLWFSLNFLFVYMRIGFSVMKYTYRGQSRDTQLSGIRNISMRFSIMTHMYRRQLLESQLCRKRSSTVHS